MNTAIFYDNETNGLPLFKEPSSHPDQPHIVQLGAVLVDLDTGNELQVMDRIIKPEGWKITEETTKIHGITHEHAMDVGINEKDALEEFLALAGDHLRIGHSESFDARIIRIAIKRHINDELADQWKARQAECTAKLTRTECGLVKLPTLIQAYKHFYGEDYANPHNALADARACKSVYMAHMFGVKIAA